MLALPAVLSAQSLWSGGGADNNFLTAANWSGGTAPVSGNTTTVQFAGSTNTSVELDDNFELQQLTFNSGASAFTLDGTGVLSIYGAGNSGISGPTQGITNNSTSLQTIDNALLLAGNAQLYALSGALTLNGTISTNSYQLSLRAGSASAVLNVNGVIQGSTGSVIFRGSSTSAVTLSGNNTFTIVGSGSVNVWEGNVYLASDTALGNSANAVTVGYNNSTVTSNVALLTDGARTIAQSMRLVTKTYAGTYTIGGSTADTSTYSGDIVVNTASSTAGSQAAMPLIVTAASGGRVNFTGNIARDSASSGSGDTLTVTGAGIVALAGSANSYSGATTVSSGTLLVNGVLTSGGGDVTVQSGATLGGSGTVNRNVVISSGATFSPGDIDGSGASMAGTFTVVGNFTAGSSAIFDFDLGSSSDTVSVTGNLTLGGTLNVNALSGFTAGRYTLFSYTGSLLSAEDALSLGSLPTGYTYALDYSVANQVALIVTSAIPEPATWALIFGCLALVVAVLRRKTS